MKQALFFLSRDHGWLRHRAPVNELEIFRRYTRNEEGILTPKLAMSPQERLQKLQLLMPAEAALAQNGPDDDQQFWEAELLFAIGDTADADQAMRKLLEGRSSFLKKRSKRLLISLETLRGNGRCKEQKFFGSFFQKRTSCLLCIWSEFRGVNTATGTCSTWVHKYPTMKHLLEATLSKVRGLDLLLSVLVISNVSTAWAQPGVPSADDMIRQLGTPPAPDSGQTRGFRVQTEDTPAAGGKPGARAASAPGAARPAIGVPLLFDLDSARLKPESVPTVSTIARALQSPQLIGSKILIEGHTDASGNAAHNLALSKRRADAVRAALVHDGGVDAARLSTVGKGQTGLANPADPLAAENRRVVLVNVSDYP